jgi:SAM-dependent methyltransferase
MDASKFYALLRFEEAALALRAVLRLGLVDDMGDARWSPQELRDHFGFTVQGTRTLFRLMEVMEVVTRQDDTYQCTQQAKACLSASARTSRRPYLAMGTGEEADVFIDLLRGTVRSDSLPLYGHDGTPQTVMDIPEAAREIAVGLASRARNFASPLATAIAAHAQQASTLADIGAGSPFVATACLQAMPQLKQATLVDRSNAMAFAREMAADGPADDRLTFLEQDFFQAVPAADVYCLSNTAHDWDMDEYAAIMNNLRAMITPGGLVCLHEPLLADGWNNAEEWMHALWMACYALALFRLTEGEGTCYTRAEHDTLMAASGFRPVGEAVKTCDGCTALFYRAS